MQERTTVTLGALSMAVAVGLGAFGAHGLEDLLERLGTGATWETAVRYQAWHALALLALGLGRVPLHARGLVAWPLLVGSLLFSGSLYALAVEPSATWLGPVTPLGGLGMLFGWVALARAAWRGLPPSTR